MEDEEVNTFLDEDEHPQSTSQPQPHPMDFEEKKSFSSSYAAMEFEQKPLLGQFVLSCNLAGHESCVCIAFELEPEFFFF